VASLDELLAASDFVTLHVPLMDATRGLLSAERIAAMKLRLSSLPWLARQSARWSSM